MPPLERSRRHRPKESQKCVLSAECRWDLGNSQPSVSVHGCPVSWVPWHLRWLSRQCFWGMLQERLTEQDYLLSVGWRENMFIHNCLPFMYISFSHCPPSFGTTKKFSLVTDLSLYLYHVMKRQRWASMLCLKGWKGKAVIGRLLQNTQRHSQLWESMMKWGQQRQNPAVLHFVCSTLQLHIVFIWPGLLMCSRPPDRGVWVEGREVHPMGQTY